MRPPRGRPSCRARDLAAGHKGARMRRTSGGGGGGRGGGGRLRPPPATCVRSPPCPRARRERRGRGDKGRARGERWAGGDAPGKSGNARAGLRRPRHPQAGWGAVRGAGGGAAPTGQCPECHSPPSRVTWTVAMATGRGWGRAGGHYKVSSGCSVVGHGVGAVLPERLAYFPAPRGRDWGWTDGHLHPHLGVHTGWRMRRTASRPPASLRLCGTQGT
jgi:hypothetical protein